MNIAIHIPSSLRQYSDGIGLVRVNAETIADALAQLRAIHPGVHSRVIDEQGKVRQHVNIFLGERNIRDLAGLATILDAAEIFILPSVTGG